MVGSGGKEWWEGGTVIRRGDVGGCRAKDAVSEKYSTSAFVYAALSRLSTLKY